MKKYFIQFGALAFFSFTVIVAYGQKTGSSDFSVSYANKAEGAKANSNFDPLGVSEWSPSKVNDNVFNIKKPRQKVVLPYRFLREEDILYRVKVIREIPINEKINMPFRYNIDEDNGNQRFIMLLLKGLKAKKIKAYSPVDDRFTEPLNYQELTDVIVGQPEVIQVTDWSDPSGNTKRDSLIVNEFDPQSVEYYRVKEEWVFDVAGGQLYSRTLGVAPLKNVLNADGSVRDRSVVFWLYYPDCREYFGSLEIYNPFNLSYRSTWEELWESKYYGSYIVKSSIQNPYNLSIAGYIKDPIMRLMESEKIKNEIFNYEQNVWSY